MTGRSATYSYQPRLVIGCAAILVCAGCQASPSSPTLGSTGPYALLPGDYTLTIYVPVSSSSAHVVCVEDNTVPDTASFPVAVAAVIGGWRLQPVGEANLGLVAWLASYGATAIGGPILGQARDPDTGVVVAVSPLLAPNTSTQADATLQGTLAGPTFAAGVVAGDVQFSLSGIARFCRPNYWILRRRVSS